MPREQLNQDDWVEGKRSKNLSMLCLHGTNSFTDGRMPIVLEAVAPRFAAVAYHFSLNLGQFRLRARAVFPHDMSRSGWCPTVFIKEADCCGIESF